MTREASITTWFAGLDCARFPGAECGLNYESEGLPVLRGADGRKRAFSVAKSQYMRFMLEHA
jgi:hypothetical protein